MNGHVMYKDKIVGTVVDGEVLDIQPEAPQFLKRFSFLEPWLESRASDLTRTHMRMILRALRIPTLSEVKSVLFVNAVSVTDSFWFRSEDKVDLTWDEVRFKKQMFVDTSLFGDPSILQALPEVSPELTNIGSFHKGWMLREGKWFLAKRATRQEAFSEIMAYKLSQHFGFDAVPYFWEEEDGLITCESFISEGENLEHIFSWVGENTDYSDFKEVYERLGFSNQFRNLYFMDALLMNPDRHEFNTGLVTKNGKVLYMAPNFDNNLAFISTKLPDSPQRRGDLLTQDFLDEYGKQDFVLYKETVSKILKETQEEVNSSFDLDLLLGWIMSSFGMLNNPDPFEDSTSFS